MTSDVKQMTPEEIHQRIIELGFAGDHQRFAAFCQTLHEKLPAGTGVVFRGSVITNERWADGQPFDANGPGTSDLDVTLVGDEVMNCWDKEAFYIPGLHTKPLSDKDPDCAQETQSAAAGIAANRSPPGQLSSHKQPDLVARCAVGPTLLSAL